MSMPRQSRYKGEFSTYHVIMRGNERKSIFQSNSYKAKFIEIIERTKKKYNFILEAYCIMDNHVHLLINDNGNDISKVIKSINISYAYYYNQINNRVGHLFQDRFKSEIIDDEQYLLQVSKYIHNNPVKAGMVRSPAEYNWSSCKEYLGQEHNCLVNTHRILGIFANDKSNAIKGYIEYLVIDEQISALEVEDDVSDKENINVLTTVEAGRLLIDESLKKNGMTYENVLKNTAVRNQLIRDIRENSVLSLKDIGEIFGGISESRVSRIVNE